MSRKTIISDSELIAHTSNLCPHSLTSVFEINCFCARGLFTLHIQDVYTFEQTADAHRVSAEGHVTGKLVIRIR